MSTRQDFTGYTVAGAQAEKVVLTDANTITITSVDDVDKAWAYKDFTASYFAADFEHTFKVKCSVATGAEIFYVWGLSDSIGSAIGEQIVATTDLLALAWSSETFILREQNGASATTDTSAATAINTDYYIRVVRDEAVGTYGTLYAYIYYDEMYTNLFDTLTVTLTESKNFRYLIMASSSGVEVGVTVFTGTVMNCTLDAFPYTLENMRTRIRDTLNETTASFWTNTELNAYINDGIRTIAQIGQNIQTIQALSTTNGTRTVAFTGYSIEALEYVTGGYGLVKTDEVRFGRLPLNGTAPQFWVERGANVEIEPKPDATYSLSAYKYYYPTDLSVDSSAAIIPPAFRQMVILYALYRAYMKDKSIAAAFQCYSMMMSELTFEKIDILALTPNSKEDLTFTERS